MSVTRCCVQVASEDTNCYTFDMRKMKKALMVHKDHRVQQVQQVLMALRVHKEQLVTLELQVLMVKVFPQVAQLTKSLQRLIRLTTTPSG